MVSVARIKSEKSSCKGKTPRLIMRLRIGILLWHLMFLNKNGWASGNVWHAEHDKQSKKYTVFREIGSRLCL